MGYIRSWESCHTQSALLLRNDTLKLWSDEARRTEGKVRDFMVGTTTRVPLASKTQAVKMSEVHNFHSFVK